MEHKAIACNLLKVKLHGLLYKCQLIESEIMHLASKDLVSHPCVLQVQRKMDDLEIVDTDETSHDVLAAYYADGCNKDHDKPPVTNSRVFNTSHSLEFHELRNCLWWVAKSTSNTTAYNIIPRRGDGSEEPSRRPFFAPPLWLFFGRSFPRRNCLSPFSPLVPWYVHICVFVFVYIQYMYLNTINLGIPRLQDSFIAAGPRIERAPRRGGG